MYELNLIEMFILTAFSVIQAESSRVLAESQISKICHPGRVFQSFLCFNHLNLTQHYNRCKTNIQESWESNPWSHLGSKDMLVDLVPAVAQ